MRRKVALPAADGFGIATGGGNQGGHVYLAAEERDVQAGGQLLHETGVSIGGLPADHMVHMQDGGLPHFAAFVQLGDSIGKRR